MKYADTLEYRVSGETAEQDLTLEEDLHSRIKREELQPVSLSKPATSAYAQTGTQNIGKNWQKISKGDAEYFRLQKIVPDRTLSIDKEFVYNHQYPFIVFDSLDHGVSLALTYPAGNFHGRESALLERWADYVLDELKEERDG